MFDSGGTARSVGIEDRGSDGLIHHRTDVSLRTRTKKITPTELSDFGFATFGGRCEDKGTGISAKKPKTSAAPIPSLAVRSKATQLQKGRGASASAPVPSAGDEEAF